MSFEPLNLESDYRAYLKLDVVVVVDSALVAQLKIEEHFGFVAAELVAQLAGAQHQ